MAEMKCYTCTGFNIAQEKGKRKTSGVCDTNCWKPDWTKLSPELKEIYKNLMKLNDDSFKAFVLYWEGKPTRYPIEYRDGNPCGQCTRFPCNLKPKKDTKPASLDCNKWEFNFDHIANTRAQKELKAIFALDVGASEYPYITHFIDTIKATKEVNSARVILGDKFDYEVQGKKTKFEVEWVGLEHVICYSKKLNIRADLVHSTVSSLIEATV